MCPGGDELKDFSDIAHSTLQKNFTKDNYTPISNYIKTEIDKLREQKEKDAVPFKANLLQIKLITQVLHLKLMIQ